MQKILFLFGISFIFSDGIVEYGKLTRGIREIIVTNNEIITAKADLIEM